MDHDALTVDLAGPTSHRAADVGRFATEFAARGLALMAEGIGGEDRYESNDQGHFAWDVALAVRAACLMHRVTGDPVHLERSVAWARHLIDRTDAARGVRDWRGRSAPVWSAGSRYNAGRAVIGDVAGSALSIQAVGERIAVERPSPTTAVVRVARANGSEWSSPEASLLPDPDYLPDVLSRTGSAVGVLLRGLPAPVDLTWLAAATHTLEPQRAAHLVHTGLIADALLGLAGHLDTVDPVGVEHSLGPGELASAAEAALLAHADELRVRDDRAWYVTAEDFPGRRLGLDLPHNQVVDAATAFLALGRSSRDERWELGRALTRPFAEELERYRSGELAHPWHYYPVDGGSFRGVTRDHPLAERVVRGVPRAEDSSHATMRVRALGEWRALDPTLVPDEHLSELAASFRRHFLSDTDGVPTVMWLPGDGPDAPRRGWTDTYVGAWAALGRWDADLADSLNALVRHHPPDRVFGATVLSAAELSAMNAGLSGVARSRTAPG